MDLGSQNSLSNWTSKDIESYKTENSVMTLAIFSDVLAFHETHIGLKRQLVDESGTSARATYTVQSDEPLEIRNL